MISVIIIVVTLLFSAFFSGMEIAYVSSNKVHIEIQKKQSGIIGNILEKLTRKPSKFIATMLVGNNIALVVYGFEAGRLMTSVLPEYFRNILWHTLFSTIVIVITAEFLPKVFFQIYANTLLSALCIPAYFFYVIFSPISSFIMWISDTVLRIFFKTKGDDQHLTFSKIELVDYISEQIENLPDTQTVDSEVQIFQNALGFSEVKAREIMIPRTEISAVSIDENIDVLKELFISTKYSKILIYKDSIDEIVGYVHSFEMFKKPKTIRSILRPVVNVPGSIFISKVLDILTKKHQSMAVVIDEYGGTSGILTLEDIVEELFGEIEDEHDKIILKELQISDKEYLFSARLEVSYINEKYKLQLPESENYETLGGLIMDFHESIPEKEEEVQVQNYLFLIEEVTDNKILTVRIFVKEEE
ncbi:hemolysin family protein [Capnocytophaga catalasegens]|uniref:Hemolysin n=1 Tax=Capnocytophaga catalasegens TaxID=1004260 RepID=A0AAV5AQM0_9FLAO|nr:hemolysin family protein [Capnocytophaga catalasegens]GIZ14275.1 hemolysin [Capnocytophaga catalasegens]GJM49618.1 hemolysin [Capnocytophaga catalasegens]GJM52899.1 hemolysin [Capnocytophaga catalasegens]